MVFISIALPCIYVSFCCDIKLNIFISFANYFIAINKRTGDLYQIVNWQAE